MTQAGKTFYGFDYRYVNSFGVHIDPAASADEVNPRPNTDHVRIRSMSRNLGTMTRDNAERFAALGTLERAPHDVYILAWARLFTAAEVRALLGAIDS